MERHIHSIMEKIMHAGMKRKEKTNELYFASQVCKIFGSKI